MSCSRESSNPEGVLLMRCTYRVTAPPRGGAVTLYALTNLSRELLMRSTCPERERLSTDGESLARVV